MTLRFLLTPLIILLLIGCQEEQNSRFVNMEALIEHNPDSVLIQLEKIQSSELNSRYDKARYAVLLTMARDKCYLPLSPDSSLIEAAEYFHTKQDRINETKARYYAGLSQRHVGNYRSATWETLNAIEAAHQAADTFWMGRTHDLAFEIYMATHDPYNAAIEAHKAAIFFKCAGAEGFHRYALLEKAQALNRPTDDNGYPSGKGNHILDSLKHVGINEHDSAIVANTLFDKILYSFDLKDFKTAQIQLDSLRLFSRDSAYVEKLLPTIISMNIAKGENPESLLKIYENRLGIYKDTLSYLHSRSEWAAAQKDWESAYRYSDSLMNHYHRLFGDKSYNSIETVKDEYNQQIITERLREAQMLKHSRNLLLWSGIGLLPLIIGGFIIIRLKNKRKEHVTMEQLFRIASENDVLKSQAKFQNELISENNNLKEKLKTQQLQLIEEINILKTNLEAQRKNLSDEKETLKESLESSIEKFKEENENLKRDMESQKKIHDGHINEILAKTRNTSIELSSRKSSLLGNKIDTLCDLAMQYFDTEVNQTYKNEIYNRVQKEIKILKTEKFQKEFESRINDLHDNILNRLQKQVPSIEKKNMRWIAMTIGGLNPNTISFLLNIKIHTLYTKRIRVHSYIEKSHAPDKIEFLSFFPKTKEKDVAETSSI